MTDRIQGLRRGRNPLDISPTAASARPEPTGIQTISDMRWRLHG